ncbi:hypothetical protein X777_04083 [Ooceraea biroi]|uniref:Uncharacterized protein n=1 Tax=Ooceraea biroi TaxID=2015173 RepID=A0A026WL84_OOCBI|nr:hypothetical protein X777_04083 [Ooceraea biroi]
MCKLSNIPSGYLALTCFPRVRRVVSEQRASCERDRKSYTVRLRLTGFLVVCAGCISTSLANAAKNLAKPPRENGSNEKEALINSQSLQEHSPCHVTGVPVAVRFQSSCQLAITIRMPKVFSNEEYTDIHFVYGFCDGNARAAVREYQLTCGGKCCSEEMEQRLKQQARADFHDMIHHHSRSLQGLLATTADAVRDTLLYQKQFGTLSTDIECLEFNGKSQWTSF